MILILGSGVAGLTCALAAAEAGAEVELVTPGAFPDGAGAGASPADAVLAGGSTAMAQGGIAAAVGPDDTPAAHAADTVAAGAGLVDARAARVLTTEGAAAVRAMLEGGFPPRTLDGRFAADRDSAGGIALGLEAAHGRARIVHAGEDRTGAALHAFLSERVLAVAAGRAPVAGGIAIVERASAVSLLTDAGAVAGAVLRDAAGRLSVVRADAVVLATGGYSALYRRTSNHPGARGEGIVLAARAGALVADLEFVQFHPTVLLGAVSGGAVSGDAVSGGAVSGDADPGAAGAHARAGSGADAAAPDAGSAFLVSEAVRGAGAVLRDGSGERFMVAMHPAAELAPRDVVSRSVHRVLRERGEDAVWLDATAIERDGGAGTLARRFPRITEAAAARGYDWAREPIPVAPAAHYTMGGVATDLDGRSSVPGLFAAGEVASTGVHGANRLASNSLLEGLVFGRRAGLAAAGYAGVSGAAAGTWEPNGDALPALAELVRELPAATVATGDAVDGLADSAADRSVDTASTADVAAGLAANSTDEAIRGLAEAGLGIERDAAGLRSVAEHCASASSPLAELAGMIATAAEARTESRGAHQRVDHPDTDPAQARRQAWTLPKPSSTAEPQPAPTRRSLTSC